MTHENNALLLEVLHRPEEAVETAKRCGFELMMEVDVLGVKKPLFCASEPAITSLVWMYIKAAQRLEREECAKVCESITWSDEGKYFAGKIRARDKT